MIKLISVIDGAVSINQFDSEIEYKPKLKYKIDVVSAINPTIRYRKHPYHEDIIEVTSIVSPEEWDTLYGILNSPTGDGLSNAIFFIEFERDGSWVQLPVQVESLPDAPDYVRYGNEKVKYSFSAIYENYTPIDFSDIYGYGNSWGSNYGF